MKVCDGGIPLWLMLLAAILLAVHCAGGVGAADSSSGSDAVLSAATSEAAAKRLQAIIANISIPAVPTIGIALAATSKRQGSRIENLTLLKSFGKTFSAIQKDSRFRYAVFVAYDAVDPVFGSEGRRASIAALFHSRYPGDYSWSWVECPYTGRPARSQNDAAMAGKRPLPLPLTPGTRGNCRPSSPPSSLLSLFPFPFQLFPLMAVHGLSLFVLYFVLLH